MPTARAADAEAQRETSWPMARTCPFQPPGRYAELRATTPIAPARVWDGSRTWLITRQEHLRALLADPRVRIDPAGLPRLSPADGSVPVTRSLLTLDAPDHGTLRRVFIPEFTVRRARAMRPGIERIVDGLLDRFVTLDRPADLVAELALPMSTLVICELLGVPYEDHEFFQSRSERATRLMGDDESVTALLELRDYLDRLITAKARQPASSDGGVLDTLVTGRLRTGELTHADVLDNAVLLLAAGHETSAAMTALSVLTLLQHPAARRELSEDPGLLPGAVEELLRYLNVADGLRRSAAADIELDGHTIRAGDGLIFLLASGNRDESVFPDADLFDIHRPARQHVAFGYGPHQCLGQNLARLELEVTLGAVLRRLPGLRLATEVDTLRVKEDSAIFGLHELPVTW
ncbi:cytochrome P450 [Streptomyces sp. NPDC000594]|uniref:cytochrome P450 n=1 Tax=Streptomyces sp. NPDC000594 TaxID=3154261 RepID=UPI003318EC0E